MVVSDQEQNKNMSGKQEGWNVTERTSVLIKLDEKGSKVQILIGQQLY